MTSSLSLFLHCVRFFFPLYIFSCSLWAYYTVSFLLLYSVSVIVPIFPFFLLFSFLFLKDMVELVLFGHSQLWRSATASRWKRLWLHLGFLQNAFLYNVNYVVRLSACSPFICHALRQCSDVILIIPNPVVFPSDIRINIYLEFICEPNSISNTYCTCSFF